MSNKELSTDILFTLANELNNRHDWVFDMTHVKAALVEDPDKLHVIMEDDREVTYTLSHETPDDE